MASLNMANINMVKVNTLIRKGYLLAGVLMAANIFIVNEVRAMDENNNLQGTYTHQNLMAPPVIGPTKSLNPNVPIIQNLDTNEVKKEKNKKKMGSSIFIFSYEKKKTICAFLYYENFFNFVGTLALSVANNYFKWWSYDKGRYGKFGCFGWRTKRFFNDYLQFDINLNLGRGIFWLIPGVLFFSKFYDYYSIKKKPITLEIVKVFIIREREVYIEYIKEGSMKEKYSAFALFILQGFISMPLTVHISKLKFSISISLDAIIWQIIWMICHKIWYKNVQEFSTAEEDPSEK